MIILTDSREQIRLFENTRVKKLLVGDYTTVKLEQHFIIERKSPQDLYQTILQGHARFRRQIQRAIDANIQMVMFIECTHAEFINKQFVGGNARACSGETLRKIIHTLSTRYNLEFNWCRDRAHMQQLVRRRLIMEEKYRNL